MIDVRKDENSVASSTKDCPFCSEAILATAIKCKHCSSMLVPIPGTSEGLSGVVPGQAINITHNALPQQVLFIPSRRVGWGIFGIVLSIMSLGGVSAALEEGGSADAINTAVGMGIFIVPIMAWILSQKGVNKVLPIVALILWTMSLLTAFSPPV